MPKRLSAAIDDGFPYMMGQHGLSLAGDCSGRDHRGDGEQAKQSLSNHNFSCGRGNSVEDWECAAIVTMRGNTVKNKPWHGRIAIVRMEAALGAALFWTSGSRRGGKLQGRIEVASKADNTPRSNPDRAKAGTNAKNLLPRDTDGQNQSNSAKIRTIGTLRRSSRTENYGASALIRPLPLGLPQPVTRS